MKIGIRCLIVRKSLREINKIKKLYLVEHPIKYEIFL
jgi:hypothetical protein